MVSGYANPGPVELKHVFDISDYKLSFISLAKKGLLLIHALHWDLENQRLNVFVVFRQAA